MKKTILMCALAAASAVSFTACQGSSNTPKNFDDSLSYYLGQANGIGFRQYVDRMPDDQKAKVNDIDAYLAGIKTVLDADTASQAYAMGLNSGMQIYQQMMQMKEAGITLNTDMLFAELTRTLKADSISQEEMDKTMVIIQGMFGQAQMKMQEAMMKKRMEQEKKQKEDAEKNLAAGKAYVQKQKAADKSIVTTASGLSYKITKQGNGALAQANDKVDVIYTGRLIDGTKFDSSEGKPVQFMPRQLVPGFNEAVTTLPVGTKATLYIPAEIGYGDREMGDIPAGSTLVFDIEIVSVTPKEAPAAE